MTEDTTGKATLQKAALGRTTAGIMVREPTDSNTDCVSPPSKSPLCSGSPLSSCPPPRAGTQKRFVAVFLAGLLAENFARQETLQKPLGTHWRGQGGVKDVPPGGCLAPKRKESMEGQADCPACGVWCPRLPSLFAEDNPLPRGCQPLPASQGTPSLAGL